MGTHQNMIRCAAGVVLMLASLIIAGPAHAGWVLPPEAADSARAVGEAAAKATNLEACRIHLQGLLLRIELGPPDCSATHAEVGLGKKVDPRRVPIMPRNWPKIRKGDLTIGMTPFIDAETRDKLAEAVAVAAQTIPWREVEGAHAIPVVEEAGELDDSVRASVLDARRRALALRRGHPPEANAPAPPPTADLSTDTPSPGSISAWIASGRWENPGPRGLERRVSRHVRRALRRGDAAGLGDLARVHRGEPRVWALLAVDALRRGAHETAVSRLDVATRMGLVDPDALALWADLTGSGVSAPPGDIAGGMIVATGRLDRHAAMLLLFAGLLLLAGALQGGSIARAGAVSVVVAGFAAWHGTSPPPARAGPAELPDDLIAPLAGGPCIADPAWSTPEGLVVYATCDGAPAELVIRRGEVVRGRLNAARHFVKVIAARRTKATERAALQLRDAVRRAEEAGWTAEQREAPPIVTGWVARAHPADVLPLRLAAVLAASGGVAVLILLAIASAQIAQALRADRNLRRGLVAVGLVAGLFHWIMPPRMVMELTGYDLLAQLSGQWRLPRYGAGAVWLYGPFLDAFGLEMSTVQAVNRVLGLLTLVPLTACALTLSGGRTLAVLASTALFAAMPVVWRDHVSEGIITGTVLLWMTALYGASMADTERTRAAGLLLAAPVAAWAATCRPEALVAMVPLALPLLATGPGWRRRGVALTAMAAVALALAPHADWLWATATREAQAGGMAPLGSWLWGDVAEVLTTKNIFLRNRWLPAGVLIWWVLGLVCAGPARSWAIGLSLSACAWVALTAVDLPAPSIPRIHLPAYVMLLPVMGLGAAWLARKPMLNSLVAFIVLFGTAASAAPVMARSNAEKEDRLFRMALAELGESGGCMATLTFDDPPPARGAHRHIPDRLFEGHRILSLTELLDGDGAARCRGPVAVVLGVRCYMVRRKDGETAPTVATPNALCQRARETLDLEIVEEGSVANNRHETFPVYPDTATLDLGVYRMKRGSP